MKKRWYRLLAALLCLGLLCGCSGKLLAEKGETESAVSGGVTDSTDPGGRQETPTEPLTEAQLLIGTWSLELDLAPLINGRNTDSLMEEHLTVEYFPVTLLVSFTETEVTMAWEAASLEESCEALYALYEENMSAYMVAALEQAFAGTYFTPEYYYAQHGTTLEEQVELMLAALIPEVLAANFHSLLEDPAEYTLESGWMYVGDARYSLQIGEESLTIRSMELLAEEDQEAEPLPWQDSQFPVTLQSVK